MAHARSADSLIPKGHAAATRHTASDGVIHRVAPAAPRQRAAVTPRTTSGQAPSQSATIGRVFFSIGSGDYACSGSSVNSDSGELVLTAGHCVYDVSTQAWATNWVFVPGYNGSDPYGEWTAAVLTTSTGFTSGGDNSAYDTGFAAVTGSSKLVNAVGAMGLETGYTSFPNDLITVGYPAQSPNSQYYCQTTADLSTSDSLLYLPSCDQQPGASGSPILDGYSWSSGLGTDVSDLTLLITSSSGTENAGPLFTSDTWNLYESIQGDTV